MAGRQSAQEAQYAAGAVATSQPAKAERQVERPLRLLGQGQVGGLVEERGQATLHCVVVSPGKVRSHPRGEHAEQVVGSGRGTKQQKQPRGLQVRQGRELSEQCVLRVTLAAQLMLDKGLASKRGTED